MEDKKEANANFAKHCEKILTEKEKNCFIEDHKYILYFSNKNINGESVFHYKYYKQKEMQSLCDI